MLREMEISYTFEIIVNGEEWGIVAQRPLGFIMGTVILFGVPNKADNRYKYHHKFYEIIN